MNIRELNKPVNSKTLNETMAKKFGTTINVESFTLEQLQDARNKIRSKVFDIETNESFGGLPENKTYSKNKLFLDVLNAAISERGDIQDAPIEEGEVPAGLKAYQDKQEGKEDKEDKDKPSKDGKMPMDDNGTPDDKSDDKPAFLKKKKVDESKRVPWKNKQGVPQPYMSNFGRCAPGYVLEKTSSNSKRPPMCVPESQVKRDKSPIVREGADEGKVIIENYFTHLLKEGAEDKAEIVMASKDMVDKLTGWMEDTAEMQTESMLELADAIRDEMGAQQSESFTNQVKPALEQLYASMETTRVALTAGVGLLTGEGEAVAPDMGAEAPVDDMDMDMEADLEPTADMDVADDFAAASAATGGTAEAGRERRESKIHAKKMMIERSRRLGTILSSSKR